MTPFTPAEKVCDLLENGVREVTIKTFLKKALGPFCL